MATTLADNICKCIFLHENVWIRLEFSLKFVPEVPIYNKPAMVQIMAYFTDAYMSHSASVSLKSFYSTFLPSYSPGLILVLRPANVRRRY